MEVQLPFMCLVSRDREAKPHFGNLRLQGALPFARCLTLPDLDRAVPQVLHKVKKCLEAALIKSLQLCRCSLLFRLLPNFPCFLRDHMKAVDYEIRFPIYATELAAFKHTIFFRS